MVEGYTGWKLFDKVTIVAKKMFAYDYKTQTTYDTGNVQGYLVDPANKKQLENARQWGTRKECIYDKDENGRAIVKERITHEPEEYTYDNDGFTLALHNSAGGSSQGGKLSFWNCWITAPDGRKFLIGIAADLLLDVLKSSTVVKGVVQEKLMFARNNGGVGMLSKSMDSYQDAIKDEAIKKKMSKGKTSKHQIGHVYETTTEKNIYFGKFYRWYEPIMEQSDGWRSYYNKCVGFKRLEKPVELVYFPMYYDSKNKMSDYNDGYMWQCREKAPARREADITIELDITMEDIIKKFETHNFWDSYEANKNRDRSYRSINSDCIGLSTSSTEYTMPTELRKALIELGYRIEE